MTEPRRYRIQVVSDLTGVATATLRAWERRYGVPNPSRTPGSYRLYGDAEITQVRLMQQLIGSGVSASEAARIVQSQGTGDAVEEEPLPSDGGDAFGPARERLVQKARDMDADGLERAARRALTLGTAREVVQQVFAPAAVDIGEAWHAGEISVAHEHLATEVLTTVVRDLLRHLQPSRPVGSVLLACFSEEQHVLPLYTAAFQFTDWGYRTLLLGARTDPPALATAVTTLAPQLVGLSCTVPPRPAHVPALVQGYAQACGGLPWLVGGGGAPALADEVRARGGALAPADPGELLTLVHQLLERPRSKGR